MNTLKLLFAAPCLALILTYGQESSANQQTENTHQTATNLTNNITEFSIVGEAQTTKTIKLLLDSDLASDDITTTCLSGNAIIPLDLEVTYDIQASDDGNYIRCTLTNADGTFSTSTPILGPIQSSSLARSDEQITSNILHTVPAGSFNETTRAIRIMNSTVTYKGETYFVYVDNDLYPIVGKVDRLGQVTTARLDTDDSYRAYEEGHHQFVIGIDKLGYLHISGDMHNYSGLTITTDENLLPTKYQGQRLLLWKSTNPQDISAFDFTGINSQDSPSGTGFGYTNFVSGMNGELILRARIELVAGGWFAGKRAWGFYLYDTDTNAWEAIHGTVNSSIFDHRDTPHSAFIWEDNGHSGGGYQGFTSGVKFDFNNTIHVSSTINNNDSLDEATHLIYAKSEDLGNTWQKANGDEITTLPLRVESVDGQADIVLDINDYPAFSDGLWSRAFVSHKQNGDACLIYSVKNLNTVTTYDTQRYQCFDSVTQSWSEPILDPTGGLTSTTFMEDINGVALFAENSDFGKIYRSFDYVDGYQAYLTGASSRLLGLDNRSIIENNTFITWVRDRISGDLNLTSLSFTPASSITQSVPTWWNESFYDTALGESFVINSVMNLSGTGSEPTYDRKDFQYLYQDITGQDFDIQMRVRNLDTADQSAFVGLMLTESTQIDGKFYAYYLNHLDGLVSTHNYDTSLDKSVLENNVHLSEWLRLTKIEETISLYRSDDGKQWDLLKQEDISNLNAQYIGIIKGANNTGNYSRIDQLRLSQFD